MSTAVEIAVRTTGGKQAASEVRNIGRAADDAKNKMRGFGASARAAGRSLKQSLGKAASLGGGLLGGAAVIGATREIVNQTRSIRRLGAQAGLAGKDMQALQARVIGISSATGIAADVVTRGIDDAVSRGRSLEESIAVVEKLGPIANLFNEELSTYVAGFNQAEKQFGTSLDDYAKSLIAAYRATIDNQGGVANIDALNAAVATMGPLARAAGMDLEGLLATYQELSVRMDDAAMAATFLRQVLTRVINTEAKREFAIRFGNTETGRKAGLSRDSMDDPAQFIGVLGAMMREGTEQEQTDLMRIMKIETEQAGLFRAAVTQFKGNMDLESNRENAWQQNQAQIASTQRDIANQWNTVTNELKTAILDSGLIEGMTNFVNFMAEHPTLIKAAILAAAGSALGGKQLVRGMVTGGGGLNTADGGSSKWGKFGNNVLGFIGAAGLATGAYRGAYAEDRGDSLKGYLAMAGGAAGFIGNFLGPYGKAIARWLSLGIGAGILVTEGLEAAGAYDYLGEKFSSGTENTYLPPWLTPEMMPQWQAAMSMPSGRERAESLRQIQLEVTNNINRDIVTTEVKQDGQVVSTSRQSVRAD